MSQPHQPRRSIPGHTNEPRQITKLLRGMREWRITDMITRHYIFKMEKVTARHIRLISWSSWFPEPDEVLKYVIADGEGYVVQDMQRIK